MNTCYTYIPYIDTLYYVNVIFEIILKPNIDTIIEVNINDLDVWQKYNV